MDSIGRYHVLSILGHGGASLVYLAVDERIGKKWAIKVIPKRNVMKDGILLLKELDHPSLPRIVEELEGRDCYYEVMDFFEGEPLKEWAERGISVMEALSASREILTAAAYLHSRSVPVIHRDIKPSNFIITKDGKVKMIDFDLAVAGEKTGMVPMGTKGYAPPEQYRGICSMRSDVFALGKTIEFLLYQADPKKMTPPDRSARAKALKICLQAALPLPEDRYADAGEMLLAFEKCYFARRRFRPLVSLAAAAALGLILLGNFRGILQDAFRVNTGVRFRENYEEACGYLSEAITLYGQEKTGDSGGGAGSEKALGSARKALGHIKRAKELLDIADIETYREYCGSFLALRHSAQIVAGSTAVLESEKYDAFRTCISDDLEYEKYLKKYRKMEELFYMYSDDAALCSLIGDSGSAGRFYEEALQVPGISAEMRTGLINSGIGGIKEADE